MPEPEPTPEPTASATQTESAIMTVLLVPEDQRPWSTDELIRDIGRPRDVLDAISNLHAAGLLHRTTDGFLFATHAAIYIDQLDL